MKFSFPSGQLEKCANSPNCISSEDSRLLWSTSRLKANGPVDTEWPRLIAVIERMPGARLVERVERSEGRYARFEFVSRVLRFVDDLEVFWASGDADVQIRSESRVGTWDIGANGLRIRAVRKGFERA